MSFLALLCSQWSSNGSKNEMGKRCSVQAGAQRAFKKTAQFRLSSKSCLPHPVFLILGYNMSIGVWVGLIALMGVDAETGVFMMLYLDLAHDQAKVEGRLRSLRDLQDATMHGAVKRIRPKFMTVATMFIGLVPIMWSMGAGAGAGVMRRIAAAMNVKPDPSA